jgi:hypothetical protein
MVGWINKLLNWYDLNIDLIYKISNIISFLGIFASQNRSNLTNLCRWNCYKWSQEILSKNVIFKYKNYVPHLLLHMKVKTHNYINRQNQSTTGHCENRNDPDLVQAFLKKWWVESISYWIDITQEEIYKISNIIFFWGIIASQNRSNLTHLCHWNCYKWSQELLSVQLKSHFERLTVATMTCFTAMECMCHNGRRICSTCGKHFPVLFSFMTIFSNKP